MYFLIVQDAHIWNSYDSHKTPQNHKTLAVSNKRVSLPLKAQNSSFASILTCQNVHGNGTEQYSSGWHLISVCSLGLMLVQKANLILCPPKQTIHQHTHIYRHNLFCKRQAWATQLRKEDLNQCCFFKETCLRVFSSESALDKIQYS